nr:hypothetical protein [Candidatus Sigynarchaeota archaeon]
MSDDIKAIKGLLKSSTAELKAMGAHEVQKRLLALMTDLGVKGKQKLDLLSTFLVHVHASDKDLFFEVFAPLFDYLRNNPGVDLFSLMLAKKGFTTTHLAAIYRLALNKGAMSVLEIETFFPKTTKTKKVLLLSKLLKHADEGLMRDTILDLLVPTILPSMPELDPTSMMNPEFLGEIMGSMSLLAMLHTNGYSVAPIIARVGEQQGPQLAMFVLLMLSNGFVDDAGIQAILAEIDNDAFTTMFTSARKTMANMLPSGMKGKAAPVGQQPPFGIPGAARIPSSPFIGKIMAKLLKFLGRFRRG